MHSEGTSTGGMHGTASTSQAPDLSSFKKEKLYACPMHPEVREKKSGKCPQCGMNLAKEEFYKVYTCAHKECPSFSVKKEKCCEKEMQMKVTSKQEYYALAQLQEEYFCPMHADVTSSQAGKCPQCGMNLEKRTGSKVKEQSEEKLVYVCPMHSEVVSDKPANCSKCGMKLQEKKSETK